MRQRFKIKITGVISQLGHNGGASFDVCDPRKKAWVTPSFRRSRYERNGWLLLDPRIYELVQGIFLAQADPEQRTACAQLRLVESGQADPQVIEVDDIEELWLEGPQSSSTPVVP